VQAEEVRTALDPPRSTMQIIYSQHHTEHAPHEALVEGRPFDTPEVPARAEIILRAIQEAHLGRVSEPTVYGLQPIQAVHDAGYLSFLRTANADSEAYFGESGPVMTWTFASRHAIRKPEGFLGLKGYYAFGWGTPIVEGTWRAAYWSAQCAITAADLVRRGEPATYALCRPPGHHAATDLYGGYCYLNNAAIAARFLQARSQRSAALVAGEFEVQKRNDGIRVGILDVDYHHGNGTQIVFYADPSVLLCSLHAHPDQEYPYYWGDVDEQGAGPGRGTNFNWPLPRGTGDAAFLDALQEALAALQMYAPDFLVVSVGFDTVDGDPEGDFCLSEQGLATVGQCIADLHLPTVLIQEGGYQLDRLGEYALAFLRPFAGLRPSLSMEES
jgi:acetoin utilization deacetylase AcuC-like enzyme